MKTAFVAIAAAVASAAAVAAPVTPAYDIFGNLAGATWGGTGIPTDPAAVTVITNAAGGQVTLGLIAHQRYDNPPLGNNGAGTYFAQSGIDTHSPSPANPFATWNVGFYVAAGPESNYTFRLLYDFDPAAGTDESAHGSVESLALAMAGFQNSWNLGMDFLDSSVAGFLTEPAYPSFDPGASGQYTFALIAYNTSGAEVGRSAIAVDVGANAVPEPGSLALAAGALLSVVALRRRRA